MIIGPTAFCAPFVLSGQMHVGDIALVAASFGQVYVGIGSLVIQYGELAILRSSVARLRLLHETLLTPITSDIKVLESADSGIHASALAIAYPDGKPMVSVGDLNIAPGQRLLVQGRSGAGKSTLLRSIAGLWPYGRGSVTLPQGASIAFLPQRGYMPDGTLASLMAYPNAPNAHTDAEYSELLAKLGLEKLIPQLHEYRPWARILSPGEQQRIAGARAILGKPTYLFVDEATSALDVQSERSLYGLFNEKLPNAALVSVAHRPTVAQYHDTLLKLDDGRASLTPLSPGAATA
jgi:putative ATP-binding cassette transporter